MFKPVVDTFEAGYEIEIHGLFMDKPEYQIKRVYNETL